MKVIVSYDKDMVLFDPVDLEAMKYFWKNYREITTEDLLVTHKDFALGLIEEMTADGFEFEADFCMQEGKVN